MSKIYYKGLDENFQCRGFQFEVGKTYKHDGKVEVCSSGFHSCENPFDVLNYYDVTSRFAKVEVGGDLKTHNEDSKIASAEITFKAELKLPEFITDCINFLKDVCKSDMQPSGHSSQLAASGDYSQLAASGDYSQLAASGDYSQLAASGDSSQLAASGDYSKLAASGHSSQLAASGHSSQLAASGNSSQLAASGDYSQLAASGDYSKLAASGDYSQLAASGDYSKLAASGHSSQLAASGNSSQLAASGDYSKLAASGHSSQLAASGHSSIAINAGVNGRVKGGKNCALALTRWVQSEKRYRITTAYVGEDGIEADTWYELNDSGDFVKSE